MEAPVPCLLDLNLAPFALLDGCLRVRMTRTLAGNGSFAITVRAQAGMRPEPGATFIYSREPFGFTGLVTHVSGQEDEAGRKNLRISGTEASFLLARRTILPQPNALAGPAESVMKQLVALNAGAAAGMARRLAIIEAEDDGARGPEVTFAGWNSNLLAALSKLAQESGTGFRLDLDTVRKKLIFRCIAGTDRSAAQDAFPRALFSIGYNTACQVRLDMESEDSANLVYLLGRNNEGVRETVPLWSGDEPAGAERREAVCEAGSVPRERYGTYGWQKLQRWSQTEAITISVPERSPLAENRDFALGDTCSIDIRNVWHDAQLTAVTDTWDGLRWRKELLFGMQRRTALARLSEKTDELWEALQA